LTKQKKCKMCPKHFTPRSMAQVIGHPNEGHKDCIYLYTKLKATKAKEKQAKAERKDLKARKEKLKTKTQWEQDTQKVFNRFIRLRDRYQPCRSCKRTNDEVEVTEGWKVGGSWDCGHYLSVGAHPELRFEPKNAYKQCKSCNGGSGKYTKKSATVSKQYRINLIEYVGIDVVDWLEGPHELNKYTIEQLKEIKRHYSTKARQLEKEVLRMDYEMQRL